MKRHELEHLIRAAAAITDEDEIVVIGSQSILGAVPNAPDSLLVSREADFYPLKHPEKADLIDGAIGELSLFDEHYGYYAQGVGPETAILPQGWERRLVKIQNENTHHRIGYCLAPIDLAASKLAAGRPKDHLFVREMLSHRIIRADELREQVKRLPVDTQTQERLAGWIDRAQADIFT
jgi:hypothetical protein